MVRKITLTEDAYKALKLLKRDDESFDELLLRLIKGQGEIHDLAGSGTLAEDEQTEMKSLKKKQAKEDQKRAESLLSQQDE